MSQAGALQRQVAVITGASRGIGAAFAHALSDRGMDVVLVARSEQPLRALAADIELRCPGVTALPVVCDVTEAASVEALVATVSGRFDAVDLLINNAGAAEPEETVLWNADLDAWWKVMEINLLGPVRMVGAFVPAMIAAGTGRIVNLASMRGFMNSPTHTAYAASKAALTRVSEALALSLQGTGVLAFGYSPGHVVTDLARAMEGADAGPTSNWTPMESAVLGLVEIAEGRCDRLSGRLLHARDHGLGLHGRVDEVLRLDGRRSILSPAFDGDPIARS